MNKEEWQLYPYCAFAEKHYVRSISSQE